MNLKKTISLVLAVVMLAAVLVACSLSGSTYYQSNGDGMITITKFSGIYGEADLSKVTLNLGDGEQEYTASGIKFVLLEEENTSAYASIAVFFVPFEDNILNFRPAMGLIYNNFGNIRIGGNVYAK